MKHQQTLVPSIGWQPEATLHTLEQRSRCYEKIRHFFSKRNVLEVEVPSLSAYGTVDPFIESLYTETSEGRFYLQTSPEFYLKRLLCAYRRDMYSMAKAFRLDEKGKFHRPEFTMLEWYRMGWNEQQLMAEVRALVTHLMPETTWQQWHYRDIFQQILGINPHTATVDELRTCAKRHIDCQFDATTPSPWLDLLFTHCIEPSLPQGLVAIDHYPSCQAALANIAQDKQGQYVAKRFEIYLKGKELANGYSELTDAKEQEKRFLADVQTRKTNKQTIPPYEKGLVQALYEQPMPPCAGVALGVDRLLMICLGLENVGQTMSFSM